METSDGKAIVKQKCHVEVHNRAVSYECVSEVDKRRRMLQARIAEYERMIEEIKDELKTL